MSSPYVSSRVGRFAWSMQRVSAVLLVVMAFVHWFQQHFTTAATSTCLTVSWRLNSVWWQAWYVMFVVLAMYHGINGLIGIINDYNPKPMLRGLIQTVLWALAITFMIVGITNAVAPKMSLSDAKEHYVEHGFFRGSTSGNPPVGIPYEIDHTQPIRELKLLGYYLDLHTNRTDEDPLSSSEIFTLTGSKKTLTEKAAILQAQGEQLESWCLKQLATRDEQLLKAAKETAIFSSTYEFAVWALNVRKTNAVVRGDLTELQREHWLAEHQVPAWEAALH